MATMQNSISIATTVTTANVLAGLPDELVPYRRARVRVFSTSSAVGINATFSIGRYTVADGVGVLVGAVAGRIDRSADMIAEHGCTYGDRLILKFVNTTGSTLIAYWAVDIQAI